ncbi:hypothetical protein Clacol_002704 [Clathrus columnatus]|uniref:Uncharacterized protein n=1 Tax=Clathrus columnatus TaxID=1419009 RepID=A0AAV5A653_9AGAM|nr:hypothetical protein Clacol_002704 [Clathrus columnatus]
MDGAVEEARKLLTEATERVTSINEDDSIPVRASKKAGTKSKKQVRDEVLADHSQKLKDVHIKYGYTTGKWFVSLIFTPADAVDGVWSRLAVSVAQGPLSQTAVDVAKVATTPPNESSGQRVICVYMPNILDKEKVLEVMRILLENHGVNLSGVKSDLYTKIGLDSKHPSHLQSTIWKNTDFLKDSEIKELRGEYFAKLKEDQAAKTTNTAKEADKQHVPKPKMTVDEDPFGSESEDGQPIGKKPLKRPAEEDNKKPAKKAKPSLRK